MFFLKPPKKKTPKRKRTIFPYVVSSGKYREYYENEVKKKNVPKRKKNNKNEHAVNESSESDTADIQYEDEDVDVSDNEIMTLEDGKYVIIRYEDNYFPGK